MIKKINTLFLFIIYVIFMLSPAYGAKIDTSLKFSTIESKHFSIHFHQGLDETALKTADFAERIHPVLVKTFKWEPIEKTQVVLIDDTDFTNGFANVLPYNTIYIQLVPPSIDMTLGEYDDWLKMIFIHEYAHILTLDPARGYSKITRKIFGKPVPTVNIFPFLAFMATAPPNVFLPRWWHEGLATWAETEFSQVGRGRSTFYEMILRMAVAEDNIPSIDQINGELPYWPDGHLPYIFGMRLQKRIFDKYGKDTLGELNMSHAGRAPYFINGSVLKLFGKDYDQLYNEMLQDLRENQINRINKLKQLPFTTLKTLNEEGERLTNPRYSPDGSLIAFNRIDPHRHEEIVVTKKDGSDSRVLLRKRPSDKTICWAPDGKAIYFTQAEFINGFNLFQDLYTLDLNSSTVKRLTNGLRIREPDISPDGESFAVIINKRGSQNLAILDIYGYDSKLTPITDYKLMRVSNPRWSPDGRSIVYSSTDNNSVSSIHIYNVAGKKDRMLFKNKSNNTHPAWSPDGKYIVYVSDETGVYNLYAYSLNNAKRYQISHFLGGAFHPDVSPDGTELILSSYHSGGFNIASIEYSNDMWIDGSSPIITPYWKTPQPTSQHQSSKQLTDINHDFQSSQVSSQLENNTTQTTSEKKPYSALKTLLPKFWLPTLYGDHKGTVAGFFTSGQDVIGYNTFTAQFDRGLSSGNEYYNITYLNNYAYPQFSVNGYTKPLLYSGLVGNEDYYERNRSLVFSISVPVNRLESRYAFTLGYHIQQQDVLNKEVLQKTGSDKLFQGRRNNVFASVDFSNTLKYPYSISAEEGRNISLTHRYYSGGTGSDVDSKEYIASYAEHIAVPLKNFRHHVVYFRLSGALSEGAGSLQQSFQLGGYPQQSEFPLRGYASRFATGKHIATGTLEYRFPLSYILKGSGTKPFFLNKLHGALFVDTGGVWDKNAGLSADRLRTGAGFEARMDVTLGYRLNITPAIGIAKGLDEGGRKSIYLTIYIDM